MDTKKIQASVIVSEIQSSDIYLTIKARLFDLKPNLNGVRVTEAFLNEIVMNEDKYVGIPLYADIRGLIAKQPIGHLYNPRTGEFLSTQIGSFYHYEKETDGDNTYLCGYARVMKRNKAVCKAIAELFATNNLKFSFELSCGSYTEDEDGTLVIDAHPLNYFEGEAIVTFPACQEATATQLIAECMDQGEEGDRMTEEQITTTAEEQQTTEEIQAEAATEPAQTEVAETETAAAESEKAPEKEEEPENEPETAECDKPEEKPEEVAETQDEHEEPEDEEKGEPEEEREEEPGIAELIRQIASMQDTIKALSEIVGEIRKADEQQKVDAAAVEEPVIASAEEAVINPFMGEIKAPVGYSLLEVEKKHRTSYTLLDN